MKIHEKSPLFILYFLLSETIAINTINMSRWICFEDIMSLALDTQYQDVTLVCNNGSLNFSVIDIYYVWL